MDDIHIIRPLQLREYLKATGWQQVKLNKTDDYVFWHPEAKREIQFPLDEADESYREALEFAYSKIKAVCQRSYRTIYQEILSVDADMLLIRMGTHDNRPHVSFESAEKSISAIERLLRSSASTIRKPQANYKRMSFVESTRLIQEARLEQTAIGSFILRVSCPVHALEDETQIPLGFEDKSFVRLVFENIHDASLAVVRAIVSDQVSKLADDVLSSEKPIISANFCDALAQVADASDRMSEVDFRWSPIIRRPDTRPIKISSEYASRLEDLSMRLRKEDAVDEEVFVGTVERLDGQIGRDGRRAGEVILALLQHDETSTVRARVDLSADQYLIADEAHMGGNAFVRVKGRLAPGRQPRRLEVIEFTKVM